MICWTDIEATGLLEREGHLLEVAVVVTDDDLNEVSHMCMDVQPVGIGIDQVPMDPVVVDMHTKNGLLAELREGRGMRRHEAEALLIHHLVGPVAAEIRTARVWDGARLAGNVVLDVCVNCKKKRGEHHEVPSNDGPIEGGFIVVCPANSSVLTQKMTRFEAKQVTLASQTPLAGSTVSFDRRWLKEHMPKLEALFSYRSIDVSSIVELAKRWAPAVYEARPKNEAGAAHRALADVRESISYLKYFRDRGFIGGGNFTV